MRMNREARECACIGALVFSRVQVTASNGELAGPPSSSTQVTTPLIG